MGKITGTYKHLKENVRIFSSILVILSFDQFNSIELQLVLCEFFSSRSLLVSVFYRLLIMCMSLTFEMNVHVSGDLGSEY